MKALHLRFSLPLIVTALLAAGPALAQDNWLTTWMASPQPTWGNELPLPTRIPEALADSTIHQKLRVSVGGSQVRVVISNEYGKQPLLIGAARVAAPEGARQVLKFGGEEQVSIAPGETRTSDPVALVVPALGELVVSLYLPQRTPLTTFHWDGKQTAFITPGNQVNAQRLEGKEQLEARLFLSDILVDAPLDSRALVVLGDSITDGNGSTLDSNRRWPDFLAQRLASENVAVLNGGISGARLLEDGMGASALARFERDVLGKPGVKSVMLMLGINDISWPGTAFAPNTPLPSLEKLIAGYRQLIDQAHRHNLRIIGTTLLPFEGALQGSIIEHYHSAPKEQLRQAFNQWIRTGQAFDAVIDFDQMTRDPRHPTRLLPLIDSGDHLHPGDAGNRAMAEGVELEVLFGGQ
ncbi:SGNH/GDSL hydrolase family protein [Pseudomonas chlororaphis]|uniref:SGNH/GDSL hydrolase family protein n=1 Tax=Pseudomonas chlororaphis TaxID=587753 RepID=UPI0007B327B5|nr:SGNH/GDSL hydrolase family protein [Pseudomonas chlororaphis]AZC61313.1 putative secreted protein [Pseudomonas chlororaphis subsp. piscium]AZC67535.1 putative secreted protein [Pseudomonas chlororaphis subsp. piscium]KZO50011.1 lipase [Pseudomonas chlororaphis subsp. piscium]MBP5070216.1 SGNH/GDSL hydrolase family protein [Pseudomonas chlororaphis]